MHRPLAGDSGRLKHLDENQKRCGLRVTSLALELGSESRNRRRRVVYERCKRSLNLRLAAFGLRGPVLIRPAASGGRPLAGGLMHRTPDGFPAGYLHLKLYARRISLFYRSFLRESFLFKEFYCS
ncbi:hypothetical protein EVAR_38304_1 [Eumeta japonica]|uniref:Uncharacterized protein n=1 Tax=Eumeta variegata TaxID=151549 RepID=A0A4C1W9K6_EUMVA|nr:hypothetical protein EVAR_38304_1 [Eumeta japonica]